MRLDIITIFPEYFAPLDVSLLGKARRRGDVDVRLHDLRDWAHDRHRTVDDTPYGGGPGMVMKPEPWGEALDAVLRTPPPVRASGPADLPGTAPRPGGAQGSAPEPGGLPSLSPEPGGASGATPAPDATAGVGEEAAHRRAAVQAPGSPDAPVRTAGHPAAAPPVPGPAATPSPGASVPTPRLVVPTPSGRPFTQGLAGEYAAEPWLVFACGRYEGIDARVIEDARERMPVDEVSIGDYVLAGGESAVLVIIEAVTRLLPGVLGNADSVTDDSFAPGRMESLLEGPVYTKPPTWRGRGVPAVLMSGDHAVIARWRRDQALARTAARRPELLARGALDDADRKALTEAGFPIDRERMAH